MGFCQTSAEQDINKFLLKPINKKQQKLPIKATQGALTYRQRGVNAGFKEI